MSSHKKTIIDKALSIDIGGMNKNELEFLYDLCSNKKILELGSMVGMSSYTIASVAIELHCIDAWDNRFYHLQHDELQINAYNKDWIGRFNNSPPDMLETFKKNVKEYIESNKIKIIKGKTSDVAHLINNHEYDIIFIDSDHSYEGVKNDITNYIHKLKPNGSMIFHDYGSVDWPGVQKAVEEAMNNNILVKYSNNTDQWLRDRLAIFNKNLT